MIIWSEYESFFVRFVFTCTSLLENTTKTFLCCFLSVVLLGCSTGFTEQDISNAKVSIKDDFEAKEFTVTEIKLVKESDRTLTGYVKLRKVVPAIGDMDFTKRCTAIMDQDSPQYTWKCE